MNYCTCEKPRIFLLSNPDKRRADGLPHEACAICKYPVNPHTHDSEEAEGWELKFDKRFTALDWSEKRQLIDIVGLDLLPDLKAFIKETRAEAYQQGRDEREKECEDHEMESFRAGLEEARRVLPKEEEPAKRLNTFKEGFKSGWNLFREQTIEAITRRIEEN